jgi:uncharacterized membrane protein YkoI
MGAIFLCLIVSGGFFAGFYFARNKFIKGLSLTFAILIFALVVISTSEIIREYRVTKQPIGQEPEEKFGLSEQKRREIYKKLVITEDRAMKEAAQKYPSVPTDHLQIDQQFQLSKETPLMPELDPIDPTEALKKIKRLAPGTTIKVEKIAEKWGTIYYFVEASNSKRYIGSGWINSIALIGQSQVDPQEQSQKQADLMEQLEDKYKDELAGEYGLTREQLGKIALEDLDKGWPLPKLSDL